MKKFKLGDAIKYVPELKEAANGNDPLARDTLKYAQMLEGNVRNTGVHACGVIIGRYDIIGCRTCQYGERQGYR